MDLQKLTQLLEKGRDSALLRFGLGQGYLTAGDHGSAAEHLARCVEMDPGYSAAWKLLGKAYREGGQFDAARLAWESGVAAAQKRGDKQAEKEMTVFLKRLAKDAAAPGRDERGSGG